MEKRKHLSHISTHTAAKKNDVDKKVRFVAHRDGHYKVHRNRDENTYEENKV